MQHSAHPGAGITDVNGWRDHPAPWESLYASFRLEVPARFNLAEATVGRHARGERRHQVALVAELPDGDAVRWTYAELYAEALRFAGFLRGLGVARGDVVACYAPQGRPAALTHLAAYLLGAISAPLSLLYGRDTVLHALRDSGATVLVTERDAWSTIADIRADLPAIRHVVVAGGASGADEAFEDYLKADPLLRGEDTAADEPAILLYTSGSTGLPKGILHAHGLLLGYLASVSLFYELEMADPGQVLWTPSDWSWIAGIVNVQMTGWWFGQVVVAGQGRFTPEWVFGFLSRHGVTHTFLTPTALKRMAESRHLRERWPGLRLRAIGTGGEPCPGAVLDWAEAELGIPVNEFYGLTEVNHLVGNCRHLFPPRPGSMGRAYPGHRLAVLDAEGRVLPDGETGEIAAHRTDPTLFLGYWRQPERTAAMFCDEWVRTGDYGHRDPEGYFWYAGRQDDLIKSAGYRIGPAEVEDTLVRHPAVAEAAVVGVPDAERGQVVKAFVRLVAGTDASEALADALREHVKHNLAAYKYPRQIEFVQSYPLTSTGKISRKALRSMHAGLPPAP
ncbi:MAG: AMP-binding protein [Casimicrobiaceae bacterium]